MFLPKVTVEQWEKIPTCGKTELLKAMMRSFDWTSADYTRRFCEDCRKRRKRPTPIQYNWLLREINWYYSYYHPNSPLAQSEAQLNGLIYRQFGPINDTIPVPQVGALRTV